MRCWWWTAELILACGAGVLSAQEPAGRTALIETLRTLDAARRDDPGAPAPRFGLALTKLALHAGGAISRPELGGQLAGESYLQGFRRNLEETFARDSMYEPALRFVIATVAHERDREQPAVITRAVARAARLWPDDSLTHLALAYVHRTALRYGPAQQEFAQYQAFGGNRGIALLEEARAAAGSGNLSVAARLYRSGSTGLDDSARARYRHDLTWVATRRELGEFDALPRDSIPAWLDRFWQRRDALALREPGDRLQEHLRRWAYVYRNFRVETPERLSGFVRAWAPPPGIACSRPLPDSLNEIMAAGDASRLADDRGDEAMLDQRAIIYMRHGAPAWGMATALATAGDTGFALPATAIDTSDGTRRSSAKVTPPEHPQSVLWIYWIQGRARAYYFVPGTNAADPLHGSMLGPLTLSPTLPIWLMGLLEDLDPSYGRAARRYSGYQDGLPHAVGLACLPSVQKATIRSEKDVTTAVRTDSYTLLFSHQLDALMQVYAVGSTARGNARLLFTTAVPGAALDSLGAITGGMAAYPLYVRLTAVDTVAGTVARSDRLREFTAPSGVGPGAFLGFTAELPVGPGRYYTHAAVFDSTQAFGSAAEWGNVVVSAAEFSLSDVVLGAGHGGVRWDNRGDPFDVNVTGGYRRNEPAPIYYEVYGRVPGRAYHTTVAVHDRGKPSSKGVRLEFTNVAPTPDEHIRLTLDLSRLSPGQHELTLSVQDAMSGQTVTTNRILDIVR